MKKILLISAMLAFSIGFCTVGNSMAVVVDFEDLEDIIWTDPYHSEHPHDGETAIMPEGYAQIDYLNFYWNDTRQGDEAGYGFGATSGFYSIYNAWGFPAELHADPFYFEGAYFTSGWNQGLNITLSGYYQGKPSWEKTIVCDATQALWFDFAGTALVDQIKFYAFGGTPYWADRQLYHFIIDDLTFSRGETPAPEPASIMLLATGLMVLVGSRGARKRIGSWWHASHGFDRHAPTA